MRIPMPFGYEVALAAPGGGKVRTRFRETVPVDIPEFGQGELPAVLRWCGAYPRLDYGQVTTLYRGGILYEPATYRKPQGRLEVDAALTQSDIEAAVEPRMDVWGCPQRPTFREVFDQPHALRPFADREPFKHYVPTGDEVILETGRPDRLAGALAAASDFVVVAGVVHRRVREPLLVASERDVFIVNEASGHLARNRFRLDQIDDALGLACFLGGLPRSAIGMPRFELLRPDLLAAAPEPAALADNVDAALKASAARLATLPVAAMRAHYDLAEAFDPLGARPEDGRPMPEPAELAGLGARLCEALLACDPDSGEARACLHRFELALSRLGTAPAP